MDNLKNSRILVAMSGGVDSSVAAAILAEQGLDIVGVTMRVVADEEHQSVFQPCCSAEMAQDARQVAEVCSFEHITLNLVENFERQVVQDFTSEYLSGRTPNPCVRCNQRLKYGTLYKKALEFDADYIATGHYVRVARLGERYCIQRAVHRPKDQSYVMGGLSQKQLAKALFPLGKMTKAEVREKARALGLKSAETPESQDICFVPDNDYKGFLQRRVGRMEPGPIVSTDGEVLGTHTGLLGYTVGQRKGLGIASGRPLYVVRIDAANNAVIVGYEEETYCTNFSADEVIWSGRPGDSAPFDAFVQIRYRHDPVACRVVPTEAGLDVELHEPERSVTPGQWAVVYDGDGRVLVSAVINSFQSAPVRAVASSASRA